MRHVAEKKIVKKSVDSSVAKNLDDETIARLDALMAKFLGEAGEAFTVAEEDVKEE